jgi:hypothetical protein
MTSDLIALCLIRRLYNFGNHGILTDSRCIASIRQAARSCAVVLTPPILSRLARSALAILVGPASIWLPRAASFLFVRIDFALHQDTVQQWSVADTACFIWSHQLLMLVQSPSLLVGHRNIPRALRSADAGIEHYWQEQCIGLWLWQCSQLAYKRRKCHSAARRRSSFRAKG